MSIGETVDKMENKVSNFFGDLAGDIKDSKWLKYLAIAILVYFFIKLMKK